MAGNAYLVLLCCFGFCFYHVFALPIDSSSDEDEDDVVFDGDYILNLGNASKSSLVTLVGAVFKNFEKNMSQASSETRLEIFLQHLCVREECESWPEWPECPALKGEYGMVTRSRECGRNTTRCVYSESKLRTETESCLCLGEQVIEYASEEEEEETTTSTTPSTTPSTTLTTFRTTKRPVASTQSTSTCTDNYENVGGFCLYLVDTYVLSHSMASMLCSWDGGSLVHVDTMPKQLAVHTLLFKHKHFSDIWLDGTLVDDDVGFTYLNRKEPEVNHWELGQPPTLSGSSEPLCRADRGPRIREWVAHPCESTTLPFVCEM